MNSIVLFVRVVALCGFSCVVQATSAQGLLLELHASVLARDPGLRAAQAQQRAAEQRVVQAQAALGPTVTLTASNTETRYREAPLEELRPFGSSQQQLQIVQPLLATARVFGVQAARAQLDQAEAALRQARAEASQRAIEAVFALLQARDAVALGDAQAAEARHQLSAAQRAFQVGNAAITDVRDAEARLDTLAAQRAAAETDLELRRQVLRELAGAVPPQLEARMLDADRLPPLAADSVLEWLAQAQAENPAVEQARQVEAAAEAELRRAWQAHAPTVDLTYTYTDSRESGTVTSFFPRRGNTSAVGVSLTLPLWASGGTQARVKEAQALLDKAQADVETARRNASLGVRQQFSTILAASGQARGLVTAVRSQDLALRANRRGYEVGIKTQADVLSAQSRWFEARRDLARSRHEAWLAWARLRGLVGRLDLALLQEIDGLMLPASPGEPTASRGDATSNPMR
ncbi:MAG: TolC family outer membrane protein [Betaproteobacteria bacterium]|jgi:outer membrane protein|nr:TolC family outer membrane protein [Rubrivivax sp.]